MLHSIPEDDDLSQHQGNESTSFVGINLDKWESIITAFHSSSPVSSIMLTEEGGKLGGNGATGDPPEQDDDDTAGSVKIYQEL